MCSQKNYKEKIISEEKYFNQKNLSKTIINTFLFSNKTILYTFQNFISPNYILFYDYHVYVYNLIIEFHICALEMLHLVIVSVIILSISIS